MKSRNDRNSMARYEAPLAQRGAGDGSGMMVQAGPSDGFGRTESTENGLFQVIWRRRWMVYVCVTLCMAAAFAYLYVATPIYTSQARILATPNTSDPMSGQEGFFKDLTFPGQQLTILSSRPVLLKAIEDAGLDKTPSYTGWSKLGIVGDLKDKLVLAVGKTDSVISIALDSPDSNEAATIVNAIVQAYITEQTINKKTSTGAVQDILENEKRKREDELRQKLTDKADFAKAHGTLALSESDRTNVITQALTKLSDALTTAQLESVTLKAQADAALKLSVDPIRVIQLARADNPNGASMALMEGVEKQLADWQTQAMRMKAVAGPNSPAVVNATRNVESLEQRLIELRKDFSDSYVSATRAAYEAASGKEAEIQKAVNAKQQEAFALNSVVADFARFNNDQVRIEKLIESLETRINQLGLQEQTNSVTVRVIEEAIAPSLPGKPDKVRIAALGLFCGLVLGVGGAWLRDFTDPRLKSPDEIRATLGLPLLGVVPRMGGKVKDNVRGKMCHLESMSDVAEAYRTLRTAIYFGSPAGQVKTMLITSPAPGDGKSTTASNLAIAMAQASRRTLLIDTDFRKPTQHRIFDLKDDIGLSSVLAGKNEISQAIQPSGIEGLDILPCGPIPTNPSEMLNSDAFATMLENLSKDYDHILLDSPPVLSVADARILGAVCETTVLVLRQQKSTKKSSEAACDEMLSVGSRLLGVVVNDVQRRKGEGYYGYSYAYGRRPQVGMTQTNGHRRLPEPADAEVVE